MSRVAFAAPETYNDDDAYHIVSDCDVSGYGMGRSGEALDLGDTPILINDGRRRSSSYPTSYDPRGQSFVTSVKNQGTIGSCWAFAGLAAMESSLIKSGLADETLDLSELHFLYFMFSENKGDKRIEEDRNYIAADDNGTPTTDFSLMADFGGLAAVAGWQAANGATPIDCAESYETYLAAAKNKTYALDENLCFASDYSLKSFRVCDAKATYDDESNIELVKKLVYTYGGVAAGLYCDQTKTDGSSNYFQIVDGTKTYYNPNGADKAATHEVEIIGWDDEYPKENFKVQPEKNGAWLAKNSWGTADSDGFVWISYYNMANNTDVIAFEFEDKAVNSGIYQYDGSDFGRAVYKPDDDYYYVQVFTADKDETIEFVGVGTTANASYEISVIKDPVLSAKKTEDNYRLNNDKMEAVTSCTTDFAGFYKQKLSSPVTVEEGERFAVCIKTEKGTNVYCSTSKDAEKGDYGRIESFPEEACGFHGYEKNSLWSDKKAALSIKAYSNEIVYDAVQGVEVDEDSVTLKKGETKAITAKVLPAGAKQKVSFENTDPDVATVALDETDSSGMTAVITAKKVGECTIKVWNHKKAKYATVNVKVEDKSKTVETQVYLDDEKWVENSPVITYKNVNGEAFANGSKLVYGTYSVYIDSKYYKDITVDDSYAGLRIDYYTVRFLGGADGGVLGEDHYLAGEIPTPPEASDYSAGGVNYKFSNWDKEITAVNKKVDYSAVYVSETPTSSKEQDTTESAKTEPSGDGGIPTVDTKDAAELPTTTEATSSESSDSTEASVAEPPETKEDTVKTETVKTPVKAAITYLKNLKTKTIKLKWKRLKNTKGYQVQIALNSKFTKSKKTITTTKLNVSVAKLKKNKTYYVRVRAYNSGKDKKKVYGKWSLVKKVKVKK